MQFYEMADARTMGDTAFTYAIPRRMQEFLASDRCPNSNFEITPMPTSLAVPTISPTFGQSMPQSEVEQWIQRLQDRVENACPNDLGRREELVRYSCCMFDDNPSFRLILKWVCFGFCVLMVALCVTMPLHHI